MQPNKTPAEDGPLFYFIEEIDLSLDNAPGTCERDFVSELIAGFSDSVVCFAPRPLRVDGRVYEGIRYVTGHRDLNPIFYPLFQLHLLWAVFTFALRHRPDAVIASPSVFPIVPLAVSTLLDIPLFSKTTGAGWRMKLPETFRPFGKYILYPLAHAMFRFFLRRARLIEVTTQQFVDDLSKEFGVVGRERFVVVPNGVNTDLFRPLDQRQARLELDLASFSHLVGYVGSLTWYSGIEELMNASPHILERFGKVNFVVVGDGPERERLTNLAKQKGLDDCFLFVGHVPYEQVPAYINAFDVSVVLWPTLRMERIGASSMKIRQYLACGCPVVGSLGHEFIEENRLGWLAVPEDPLQVSDAVCEGLSLSEEEKKSLSARARRYAVNEFSIASLVRRRYELWVQTIGKTKLCGEELRRAGN